MRLDDQFPEFPASSSTSSPAASVPLVLRNVLYEGDCLDILARLPAGSVDMILCDLPYGTTQNKWDSVIDLGDTIGAATPETTASLLENVEKRIGPGWFERKAQIGRAHV